MALASCLLALAAAVLSIMTAVADWPPPPAFLQVSQNLLLILLIAVSSRVSRLLSAGEARSDFGRYRLIRPLGAGGMGQVYLAEHRMLKRLCALKVIRHSGESDVELRHRFTAEAQAASDLSHWNTVEIYDYGLTPDGVPYYAMEYLRGMNLAEIVECFGPQHPGRVIYVLKQVCETLSEAHRQGLVHRDIKPGNIFLSRKGNATDVVKVLDFGLVRKATSKRRTSGEVVPVEGSPRFMCPEQARGELSDIRGDLYALAAVGYFLLTGRAPFESSDQEYLISAHAFRPVPDIRTVSAGVPDDLAAVIMKSLRKDRNERFETPESMSDALGGCHHANSWGAETSREWWVRHDPEANNPHTEPEFFSDQTLLNAGSTSRRVVHSPGNTSPLRAHAGDRARDTAAPGTVR